MQRKGKVPDEGDASQAQHGSADDNKDYLSNVDKSHEIDDSEN